MSADAEMLWCQAVGALFVGMLSELVYTSILGMLGGMAYGRQGSGWRGGALQHAPWLCLQGSQFCMPHVSSDAQAQGSCSACACKSTPAQPAALQAV